MVLDSHRTNGPSSMVGTSPFGFNARYCGVLTTPKLPPASRRWYCWPSSSQHQSTFCTLTELFRPQILSIASSSRSWRASAHRYAGPHSGYCRVDQPACDADLIGQQREVVQAEPGRGLDLARIWRDVAGHPVAVECDHERVREGPRLAREVTQVGNLHTDFLFHFPHQALLE